MNLRSAVYLIVVLLMTACPSSPPEDLEPTEDPIYSEWQDGEVSFIWNPQTVASIYDLEYQVYLLDLQVEDSHLILGRTIETQFTLLPELEGEFLLGVNAIKLLDEEDFLEGPTCWSNNSSCVKDGNTFSLNAQTLEDDILYWRIIWNPY